MGLHLRQRARAFARRGRDAARPSVAQGRRAETRRRASIERANRVVRERRLNYDRLSFCLMACALWAMLRFAFGEVMAPNGANVEVSGRRRLGGGADLGVRARRWRRGGRCVGCRR